MLRWVNHHLRAYLIENQEQSLVPKDFAIANLDADLADCVALAIVLHQVAPKEVPCDLTALEISDKTERAAKVIADAKRVGVERFEVRPSDLVTPRARMCAAFLAAIIGTYPGLDAMDGFDLSDIMQGEEDNDREERAFRMWMTSLGLDFQVR